LLLFGVLARFEDGCRPRLFAPEFVSVLRRFELVLDMLATGGTYPFAFHFDFSLS